MVYRKYEVWHDESKEGGYHHGLLLIPVDKKEELIRIIKEIRKEYDITDNQDFKFAGSLNSEKKSRMISNILCLFSHIIKVKDEGPIKIINPKSSKWHKENNKHYLEITELFGCKFGLLKIEDNMKSLHFDTYAKKVEKTFNFILKSCCHSMFDKNNPIEIVKFYFDGDEHYNGEKINVNKLFSGSLREYVKISDNVEIDTRQIKDRNDDTKILINFVDNIIGAWRSLLNNESDKYQATLPIKEIHKRVKENKIFSNKNGRWYKSISISEFQVIDDKVDFPCIFRDKKNMSLFFSCWQLCLAKLLLSDIICGLII